jgi:hypothetical protein
MGIPGFFSSLQRLPPLTQQQPVYIISSIHLEPDSAPSMWEKINYQKQRRYDGLKMTHRLIIRKMLAVEQIKPLMIHWMYKPNGVLYRRAMKSFTEQQIIL